MRLARVTGEMRTARRLAGRDAVAATLALLAAVAVGSGGFADFDPALLGYFAATVVAAAGVTWRLSAFWRRPASAFYARALWQSLMSSRRAARTARHAGRDLAAQDFIRRRSRARWLAHLLLSLGTLGSFAITLPLVFGWMHFSAVAAHSFRVVLFTLPTLSFDVDSAAGWMMFHALSLCGVAVTLGSAYFVSLRLRARRLPEAISSFAMAPLLLLLGVALSGLALPACRSWPAGFQVAAVVHEIAVVTMLIALPFSKLSHLLVRPLQLGVRAVRDDVANWDDCLGCGSCLAPLAQQQAVALLLAQRGLKLSARVRRCPACRRKQMAATQAAYVNAEFQPSLGWRSDGGLNG